MAINRNLLLSEFVNTLHLKIMDSGYAKVGCDWHYSRMCSPYSRLYLIHAGEGCILFDGKSMLLEAGHIYLIPAGLTFDYACHDYMHQLYFHINLLAADGYDLLSGLDTCCGHAVQVQEIETMVRLYLSRHLPDAVNLQHALYRYMAFFISQSALRDKLIPTCSPFLGKVYSLVGQSLGMHTTIESLARIMMMPSTTIAKRFKAETGMTLGKYIDELLFQKTQQMLLSTDLTIGQISDQLGFCDQFYFARYFRHHRHETPSQYRKRLRAKI